MASSSLAAQLSKTTSLNAALYVDRSRRKFQESYLFNSHDADQHDLESLHALGVNGLARLKAFDSRFSKYENTIFSDASRGVDRTLQSASQNTELDQVLDEFLADLAPYILETPTAKALEWIIRRFRVHEFNVGAVMSSFLPYHDTPQFTKMLSILHIEGNRLWSFLQPTKKAAKPLPRSILVTEMVSSIDLARFVLELSAKAVERGGVYRTLIGFTVGVGTEYISQVTEVSPEIGAFLIPAMSNLFSSRSTHDAVLAGCIVLGAASQSAAWSPGTLTYLTIRMVKGQRLIKDQSILPFVSAMIAPQSQLDDYSNTVTDSILSLPHCPDALVGTLKWAGSEKFILALLPSLTKRCDLEQCKSALVALLSSVIVPDLIIKHTLELILEEAVNNAENGAINHILGFIFQRHGELFSEISASVIAATQMQEHRQALTELIQRVTLPPGARGDHNKLILHANSADITTRVSAIQGLLSQLTKDDISSDTQSEIHEALKTRLSDTDAQVVEAIYSQPHAIISAFSSISFVDVISLALKAPDIPRAVMRLHLDFIANHIYPKASDLGRTLFEKVYFPFLLFSKPRQKRALLVWQSLGESDCARFELFTGCNPIVAANQPTNGESRSIEEMGQLDLALAGQIAGNIVQSNEFFDYLEMLIRISRDTDGHTVNLCYLVIRSLLSKLSGEHQVHAAKIVLSAMDLPSLDLFRDTLTSTPKLQEIISGESLGKAVAGKPNSRTTFHRLQIAILALIPVIPLPVGIDINWIGSCSQPTSDTRGKNFVDLAKSIYSLANTSSAVPSFSTNLTKALFITIREQALLFLAGIWTDSLIADMGALALPQAALFHAVAFLKAQIADTAQPHDFQVILPALLLGLRAQQPAVRATAFECVSLIAESTRAIAPISVYALDTVYDKSNEELQYLEWDDLRRFAMSLGTCGKHFMNDADYLGVFMKENLNKAKTDSKRDIGYKEHVLCYLLSHVVVWDSIPARVLLLSSLRYVHNRVKLQLLLPLLQTVVSGQINSADSRQTEQYLELLVEIYDREAVNDMLEPDSNSWSSFVRLIPCLFSEAMPLSPCKVLLKQLADGLFHSLPLDNCCEICTGLVEAAVSSATSRPIIKEAFGPFLQDGHLVASLISRFVPESINDLPRVAKRAKLATDNDDVVESPLQAATVLFEMLVAYPMPGSVELMANALDGLSRICHSYSSYSEANYVMQLLLSVLESVTLSLSDTTTLASSSIRMEVLVELLRISDNPQTFNQALLLIANIARLAPEFVMQNVMPIFTFMGSNVFHRDDSYSFRVVQKTVDNVVPVVVMSLKRKHSDHLELQKASREVLRVFTDASTHVPRHRRTQFFNHLIECLGHHEFVLPICLLLVDKVAHRVVRQKAADQMHTLNLPLTIIRSNYPSVPFKLIEQFLQEAVRCIKRMQNPADENEGPFLESLPEEDPATVNKQVQAILLFVDLVLQQSTRKKGMSDEISIRECVRLLLNFSTMRENATSSGNFVDISRIAIKALGHLLRVVSVTEFMHSVCTLLQSNDPLVINGILNLLASRLTNVTLKMRQEVSPMVVTVTEEICNRLEAAQDTTSFRSIMSALRAIGRTAESTEVPILSKALPIVLKSGRDHPEARVDTLQTVLSLCSKLGPRILPMFKDVVCFCSDILHDDKSQSADQDALAVLLGLLSTVSQFWSVEELTRLGRLSLDTRPMSDALRKALAQKVSAKQLLPALFRIWEDLLGDQTTSWRTKEAFFNLFKRVLRKAPRVDVHEHIKATFKLFLEAFDQCTFSRQQPEDAANFETLVSAAFVDMTTKLNEATFKPLFRRLFDWAFNQSEASNMTGHRLITFTRVMASLIKLLKGLITPYMGIVLDPAIDLLSAYKPEADTLSLLWLSTVDLFETSITNDEGAFWREESLGKVGISLVKQIPLCPYQNQETESRAALKRALVAVIAAMDDDTSLKKLDLDVLMQTRSEDAQVRLFALECADNMWQNQGDKLTGLVTDVITFIAECADDENEEVAKTARKFKRTVEQRCGSLDMLIQ